MCTNLVVLLSVIAQLFNKCISRVDAITVISLDKMYRRYKYASETSK